MERRIRCAAGRDRHHSRRQGKGKPVRKLELYSQDGRLLSAGDIALKPRTAGKQGKRGSAEMGVLPPPILLGGGVGWGAISAGSECSGDAGTTPPPQPPPPKKTGGGGVEGR